jgi:HTH-type transcriptional regulator, transcriptional repressor of NAD biosynthesis genes
MAKDTRTSITLTGPESTGKTELAQRLARAFGIPWSQEYARAYVREHGPNLTAADVEPIARGQMEYLDEFASAPVVLQDTDLISTVVYARHHYGECPGWIVDEALRRRATFYLLFDTDVPWLDDPARDAGGDVREDLFDAFRAALDEFATRWLIVRGDWEERFERCRVVIESLGVPLAKAL